MNIVTLSLRLQYDDAIAVLQLLKDKGLNAHISPVEPKEPKGDVVPTNQVEDVRESLVEPAVIPHHAHQDAAVTTAPTAGKTVKMPGFMRTQTQIDNYTSSEASRVEALDEEAELREQRRQERLAKKEEKDAEALEKKETKAKADNEVAAIKEATLTTTAQTSIVKPWEL